MSNFKDFEFFPTFAWYLMISGYFPLNKDKTVL